MMTDEQFYEKVKDNTLRLSYSSSKLLLGGSSPLTFKRYFTEPKSPKTAGMEFGNVVHTLFLEPDLFHNRYLVLREKDLISKSKHEDALQEKRITKILKRANGRLGLPMPITEKIYKEAKYMWYCLNNNADCRRYNKGEKEVFIKGEIEDILFRGYVDIKPPKRYCADLKYGVSVNARKFSYVIQDLGYDLQAAIYTKITGRKDFYIIAIEKSGKCRVFNLKNSLANGQRKLKEVIARYKMLRLMTRGLGGDYIWNNNSLFEENLIDI